jgi:ActR/RegA family two-component response regulator
MTHEEIIDQAEQSVKIYLARVDQIVATLASYRVAASMALDLNQPAESRMEWEHEKKVWIEALEKISGH